MQSPPVITLIMDVVNILFGAPMDQVKESKYAEARYPSPEPSWNTSQKITMTGPMLKNACLLRAGIVVLPRRERSLNTSRYSSAI